MTIELNLELWLVAEPATGPNNRHAATQNADGSNNELAIELNPLFEFGDIDDAAFILDPQDNDGDAEDSSIDSSLTINDGDDDSRTSKVSTPEYDESERLPHSVSSTGRSTSARTRSSSRRQQLLEELLQDEIESIRRRLMLTTRTDNATRMMNRLENQTRREQGYMTSSSMDGDSYRLNRSRVQTIQPSTIDSSGDEDDDDQYVVEDFEVCTFTRLKDSLQITT